MKIDSAQFDGNTVQIPSILGLGSLTHWSTSPLQILFEELPLRGGSPPADPTGSVQPLECSNLRW